MKDTVKYSLGDTVYLALNSEKFGMVTGILYRNNGVSYLVTWEHDMGERYHNEIELAKEKVLK